MTVMFGKKRNEEEERPIGVEYTNSMRIRYHASIYRDKASITIQRSIYEDNQTLACIKDIPMELLEELILHKKLDQADQIYTSVNGYKLIAVSTEDETHPYDARTLNEFEKAIEKKCAAWDLYSKAKDIYPPGDRRKDDLYNEYSEASRDVEQIRKALVNGLVKASDTDDPGKQDRAPIGDGDEYQED